MLLHIHRVTGNRSLVTIQYDQCVERAEERERERERERAGERVEEREREREREGKIEKAWKRNGTHRGLYR